MARPFAVDSLELTVTASIGVGISPIDGHDCRSLLKRADARMYERKSRTSEAVSP
jgi:GGDEF domain-containing protein